MDNGGSNGGDISVAEHGPDVAEVTNDHELSKSMRDWRYVWL